ncbi:MAG: hypothetical protein U1E76_01065 [Planctomycetota bacterium]
MRTVIGTVALMVLTTMPAFAQKMGSANRNAPTINQTITFGKDTIEISYISITWAEGNWAKSLEDEAKKAQMRAGINKSSRDQPARVAQDLVRHHALGGRRWRLARTSSRSCSTSNTSGRSCSPAMPVK